MEKLKLFAFLKPFESSVSTQIQNSSLYYLKLFCDVLVFLPKYFFLKFNPKIKHLRVVFIV